MQPCGVLSDDSSVLVSLMFQCCRLCQPSVQSHQFVLLSKVLLRIVPLVHPQRPSPTCYYINSYFPCTTHISSLLTCLINTNNVCIAFCLTEVFTLVLAYLPLYFFSYPDLDAAGRECRDKTRDQSRIMQ